MLEKIFDIGIKTATVTRYSQSNLMRDESVMEHTGQVAFLCLIIGGDHPDVDRATLLTKAIIHDIEESHLGDIASPVKHNNDNLNQEIDKLATKFTDQLLTSLDSRWLMPYWTDAKDDSLEGRIVKMADVLTVVMKIYEEVIIYHNYSLIDHGENTMRWIQDRLDKEKDDYLLDVLEEAEIINAKILDRKNYAHI